MLPDEDRKALAPQDASEGNHGFQPQRAEAHLHDQKYIGERSQACLHIGLLLTRRNALI
jgi:hypothetical protein